MTPQEFHGAYRAIADRVSAGTGIDPIALLAQWANETDWAQGWLGAPYNLANIRNGLGGSIVSYPSLEDFVTGCIDTWRNGYYAAVLAASNAGAQLAAIVASPWSAGHYGGSLAAWYGALEAYELTPEEHGWLQHINLVAQVINGELPGETSVFVQLAALKTAVDNLQAATTAALTPAQAQMLQETHDGLARLLVALRAV